MRILFLCNFFPPHHLGGYEELCAEVRSGLQSRGHRVAVLTSRHGVSEREGSDADVLRRLHLEVDLRPWRGTWSALIGRRRRLRQNLHTLRRAMGSVQPDVVVSWGMWNLQRGLLMDFEPLGAVPLVGYVADYWPLLPDAYSLHWTSPARHFWALPLKRIMGWSEALRRGGTPPLRMRHVACVSEAVRRRLLEAGVAGPDARVIRNGIDVRRFNGSAARRRRPGEPLALCCACRLAPEKGVDVAIRAVAVARQRGAAVALTIIGSGAPDYEAELRREVARQQIADRVSFRGRVPREQMPERLAEFDALVVPSRWPEPLPRILQEAMASGVAVVAASLGGIGEAVEHEENGLLFDPGDAEALAACLLRLHADPGLSDRLAAAARETVRERFDIRRTVTEVESFLRDVVDGESRVPAPPSGATDEAASADRGASQT